jgi:hypothetical protein
MFNVVFIKMLHLIIINAREVVGEAIAFRMPDLNPSPPSPPYPSIA